MPMKYKIIDDIATFLIIYLSITLVWMFLEKKIDGELSPSIMDGIATQIVTLYIYGRVKK